MTKKPDDDYDETYETDDDDLDCMTCGGDGFVDNVAMESGRYGWDKDGPGDCPNCGGSGRRKDQKWW